MAPVKNSSSNVCDFCGRPSNDILYGPIHRLNDITCHYYCLLFSSNLDQNGRDDEGILGFLLPDIKKELTRAKSVKCAFCIKPGAVSVCHVNKCKKKFHLPCGLERGSLHLFYEDFRSYCGEHRRRQRIPADILKRKDVSCSICFDPVEDLTSNDSIWAPCCKKNGWFHRLCIQKFALNAAYFFKCPLCASQDKFRDAMLRNGIYIPDQDASWELEPNAFAELLERHQQCDAGTCKCPKGRKFSSENSRFWNIILCRNCASKGIHVGCIPGPKSSLDRRSVWDCSDCNVVIQGKKNSQGQDAAVSISYHMEGNEDDEDEIIVVDDDVEPCDNTCDKVRDVSNIDLRNQDIQHILSNVIQLKSSTVDFIDLVNDDNEAVEEKLNDDDEMHILVDEVASVKEEPRHSEITKENSMDFRIEVGKDFPLYSTEPFGITRMENSDGVWPSQYSRREGYISRKLSSSFTPNPDSFNIIHSNFVHPSDYPGLKSPSANWRKYASQRIGSNCPKCTQLMQVKVGCLYKNLLFDGWREILNSPSVPPRKTDGYCCKDLHKMHWVRKVRWVCGLTSFLSDLRQSIVVNKNGCLPDSNMMLIKRIGSDRFYNHGKRMQPGRYADPYPEISVQCLS